MGVNSVDTAGTSSVMIMDRVPRNTLERWKIYTFQTTLWKHIFIFFQDKNFEKGFGMSVVFF